MRRGKGLVAPAFQSDEEEFEFWEAHDVEDYVTGETVPLSSIIGPIPPETGGRLVVTLRFHRGRADARPLARHFALPVPPDQADRDFSVLFQEEALPPGIGGYAVDYHRRDMSWGASAGPVRELTADLAVDNASVAKRAAEIVVNRINGSPALRKHAGAPPPTALVLPRRLQRAVGSIARWLRKHHAVALSESEAAAILHP